MRNPNRIEPFCNMLAKEWSKVPDWRFGQLIENFKRYGCSTEDLFYMEDDEFEKKLKEMFDDK